MKSAPPLQWKWSALYLLIVLLLGYGYCKEKAERISQDQLIHELLIVQDAELGDYHNFIDGLLTHQQQQEKQIWNAGQAIQRMQRTIYEMYHELRKYDKTLPPWGGEYKPIDPRDLDKWIKNDTEI